MADANEESREHCWHWLNEGDPCCDCGDDSEGDGHYARCKAAAKVCEYDRPHHVIDAAHLANQRAWSLRTFGPGTRLLGVLDHIRKELAEIEADPTDLREWVDVIILAFDGAWRAGWEPQQIIDAIKAKQAKNEARTWPDWRTMSPDQAIEHDRSADDPCTHFGARGGPVSAPVGSAGTHKTKRKRLRKRLRAAGLDEAKVAAISERYARSQAARRATT